MKKIYVNGYITYNGETFTFVYEHNRLTLISFKHQPCFFREYKYVDYFEGFTLDGFDIAFYIDDDIYYKDGSYICFPKVIFISHTNDINLFETQYDSISFYGGIINRFYSNRHMIDFDIKKYNSTCKKDAFTIKEVKDTVSPEYVNINSFETEFEFSVTDPGWKDDGIFTFGNYDSLLRVKYSDTRNYKEILLNIISIQKFFQFCCNRKLITFDKVYLEKKNEDGKYVHTVDIYIPFMVDKEDIKELIIYDDLEGRINNIFQSLESYEYIFSNIPKDTTDYASTSNKDFVSVISCFQSIFQHMDNSKYETSGTNKDLKEVKEEIIPYLEKLSDSYKGVNGKKRKYIDRFIHIVETANIKLEKQIEKVIEEHNYVVESLFYEYKDQIKELGIENACEKAIETRDNITHEDIVELNDIDIGMYTVIVRLNYILLLESSGVDKAKIKHIIEYLSQRKII